MSAASVCETAAVEDKGIETTGTRIPGVLARESGVRGLVEAGIETDGA